MLESLAKQILMNPVYADPKIERITVWRGLPLYADLQFHQIDELAQMFRDRHFIFYLSAFLPGWGLF